MTRFFVATQNEHKLEEISLFLEDFNVQKAYQQSMVVEETGLTFIENALIKARHAAKTVLADQKLKNIYILADDSGLIVPCLNNEPGIYSARYAREEASDEENRSKLLHRLNDIPLPERQAYFYCTLVAIRSALDPVPLIFTGKWHGLILNEERGQNGFGYDPIFYLAEIKKTAAELSQQEKNAISHRGQALRKLAAYFNS